MNDISSDFIFNQSCNLLPVGPRWLLFSGIDAFEVQVWRGSLHRTHCDGKQHPASRFNRKKDLLFLSCPKTKRRSQRHVVEIEIGDSM